MVFYGILKEVAKKGWMLVTPKEEMKTETKKEADIFPVKREPDVRQETRTQQPAAKKYAGRHYRGVRQRPWGKFAALAYDRAAYKMRGSKELLYFPLQAALAGNNSCTTVEKTENNGENFLQNLTTGKRERSASDEVDSGRECRVKLEEFTREADKMSRGMVDELLCGRMTTPPLTPSGIDMSSSNFLCPGQLMVN